LSKLIKNKIFNTAIGENISNYFLTIKILHYYFKALIFRNLLMKKIKKLLAMLHN